MVLKDNYDINSCWNFKSAFYENVIFQTKIWKIPQRYLKYRIKNLRAKQLPVKMIISTLSFEIPFETHDWFLTGDMLNQMLSTQGQH